MDGLYLVVVLFAAVIVWYELLGERLFIRNVRERYGEAEARRRLPRLHLSMAVAFLGLAVVYTGILAVFGYLGRLSSGSIIDYFTAALAIFCVVVGVVEWRRYVRVRAELSYK